MGGFKGWVSGVCEEAALARGVRGWVRNEFDGSVSIEAEGEGTSWPSFFDLFKRGT
jgi:acylphosphatase